MARRPRRPTRIGPFTHIHREMGAWSLLVVRGGQRFPEYFGNAVWGGRQQALVAAQRFRDRLLLRIGPDTRVRRQVPTGTRSATGVVGVTRERYVVGGRVYVRYLASWQDLEEGPLRRRFSVARYGKERAFALARKTGVAHSHAVRLAGRREEARRRLRNAPPMPRQVKDPRDRKGISMARRRPRRVK